MLCSYQFARAIDGVFEASDEVIGAVESGVDFEKRIAHIYQLCRTAEQISFEFDALQGELEVEIAEGQRDAREKLLNNFDQEVIEKVRCVTMPNQPVPRRSRASGPAPHGSEGRGRQYVPGGTRPEARRQVEQPIMDAVAGRNSGWFDAEMDKLDRWAEDRRQSLKTALDDLDAKLRDLRKTARSAPSLPEKLA